MAEGRDRELRDVAAEVLAAIHNAGVPRKDGGWWSVGEFDPYSREDHA
jgi:hypothetical protein